MRTVIISSIVWWGWFAMFAALELPAVFGHVPWTPLSDYIWMLEDHWKPLPYFVVGGFAALLTHLVVQKFH